MKSPDPTKPSAGGGDSGAKRQPEERIMDTGREMASEASEEARSAVERGKSNAADAVERTSEALDETAANLASEGQETLAEVASMLSGQLSGLARSLESRSLDDLASDARELARRNPGMFMAGGLALGVALSRFFKASGEHQGAEPGMASRSGGTDTPIQPYGTEAVVPPEVRAAAQRSGSSTTSGGAQGSSGTPPQGRTS